VQSYTTQDETFNPITPRKNSVLNGNYVLDCYDFDLQDIFQEYDLGVK